MSAKKFTVESVEESESLVKTPQPAISTLYTGGETREYVLTNFLSTFYAPKPETREEGEQNTGKTAGLGVIIGVFLPNIQNVFGILMFLRLYWVVGIAGVGQGFAIVFMCCLCTFLTSISVSAVATNGVMQAGGPYFIISRNLGPGIGAGVGLLFFMANAVATAMYIAGAVEILIKYIGAESLPVFMETDVILDIVNNTRVYGTVLLLILFAITSFGVKYVQLFAPLSLAGVLVSILCIYAGSIAASFDDQPRICLVGDRLLRYHMWNNETMSMCHNNSEGPLYNCFCGDPDRSTAPGVCMKLNKTRCKDFKRSGATERSAFPGFGSGLLSETIYAHYNQEIQPKDDVFVFQDVTTGFFILLAIYFPSVTGIMTGCNMSGDLKNPQRDIPRGTIAAQLFTSFVYLSFVLIFGGCIDPLLLRDRYGDAVNGGHDRKGNLRGGGMIIASFSWPRTEWIVLIGSFTSTFGAAIQSLVSAPRLLQAVASDEIVPVIRWFGVLNCWNEPWRALVLTVGIAEIFVLIGLVDEIAQVLGYFFLMCYFFVNVSCAVQTIVGAPNWRPRFQYYHWSLSMSGALLSLIIMLLSKWYYCLAVFLAWGVIYFYVNLKGAKKEWGSGLRGLSLSMAQQCLLWYQDEETHAKNWRPQFAVLLKPADVVSLSEKKRSDPPQIKESCQNMLHFQDQLRGGRGLALAASVLFGHITDPRKRADADYLKKSLKWAMTSLKLRGFADVAIDGGNGKGISMMLQSLGMGGLRPNILVLAWPTSWASSNLHEIVPKKEREIVLLEQCFTLCACGKMALMLVKGVAGFPKRSQRVAGFIDVWWVMEDGGLLLLIPFLLKKNVAYSKCLLRVYAIAGEGDSPTMLKTALETWCYDLRIDAEVHVVSEVTEEAIDDFVAQRTLQLKQRLDLARSLKMKLHEAAKEPQLLRDSCNTRQEGIFQIPLKVSPNKSLAPSPKLKESTSNQGTLQDINLEEPSLTKVEAIDLEIAETSFKKVEKPEETPKKSKLRTKSPTSQSSSDSLDKILKPKKIPSVETARSLDRNEASDMSISDHSQAEQKIRTAVQLNRLIRSRSGDAILVVLNSPKIPVTRRGFLRYMEYLEALTYGIDHLLLLKGTGKDIITIYS